MIRTFFAVTALAIVLMLCSTVSYAKLTADIPCGMTTENATVSISFNGIETDVTVIKTKLDAKIHEIEQLGKEAGLEKFDLQSMNYNISPQNDNSMSSPQYRFSGNVGFSILPAGKATDLMATLTKKGYQTSVNVNTYRSGRCGQSGQNINIIDGAVFAPPRS